MIALLVPVKCAALLHHRPHVRWVQQAASSTFQIPLPASMYVFLRMFVACLTRCTTGCPGGYSGNRCEIKPAGTGGGGKQSCSPATGGDCQNGSKCNLNSVGLIYCSGTTLLTCTALLVQSNCALQLFTPAQDSCSVCTCCLLVMLDYALLAELYPPCTALYYSAVHSTTC
jgi:hypothetical protein